MRVLLDTCLSGGVAGLLKESGHDVVSAADWATDPGDDQILGIAFLEARVLVTLDRDFGELAIRLGKPHSGILRIVGFTTRQHAAVCLDVLGRYEADFIAGALVTAEPGRVRIRTSGSR
jgi:predicted nuclease of predicted toxin-antitoxin system